MKKLQLVLKLMALIIISNVLLSNCKYFAMDYWYTIRVKNDSFQTIYVYGAFQSPDTLLSNDKPSFLTVVSGKSNQLYDRDIGDSEFKKFSTQRLTIFFLSKDTVDKYDWNKIRDDYMILERREIIESDLVDNGITFP